MILWPSWSFVSTVIKNCKPNWLKSFVLRWSKVQISAALMASSDPFLVVQNEKKDKVLTYYRATLKHHIMVGTELWTCHFNQAKAQSPSSSQQQQDIFAASISERERPVLFFSLQSSQDPIPQCAMRDGCPPTGVWVERWPVCDLLLDRCVYPAPYVGGLCCNIDPPQRKTWISEIGHLRLELCFPAVSY
jgi:hypothetical protein